ncbi:MAG: FecR domain-containing protein [Oricola sp.]
MKAGWKTGMLAMAALAAAVLPLAAQAEAVGKLTTEKAMISRGGGRIQEGAAIARGDRLSSNATGSGVIVFQDESSARMGPNAQLTIDEFVYNPQRHTGTIKLRQTSGLARIYGGQISKRGTSEVRTPHIVLGVRGGIVDIDVLNGKTIATLRGGLMVCKAGGNKRTVTNPGISCVSDGQTLLVQRIAGSGKQLVIPAAPGGGSSGNGDFNGAHCASGPASILCRSRDGGLPRPGTNPGGDMQPGGPGGGYDNY